MIDKKLVEGIVVDAIEDPAMFLVEVTVRPGNLIVVEVDSENPIGIDDCTVLSRKIEDNLDRDVEDYELEVGSAGLTKPFRIPRQYTKNIGNDVEVLTAKGAKMSGVLKAADDLGFTVTITTMEKPEGAKKKVAVETDLSYQYDEVKYTKYLIRFK